MSGKDVSESLRRANEESYFSKRENELIEKMRQKAAEAAERKSMGDTLGIADEEVISELIEIGFTRETIALLHLTPLVQVAWASDGVSTNERKAIVDVARLHHVKPGSEADRQLAEWLDVRPSDEFFARSIRAIRAFVSALPADERQSGAMSIIDCCTAVARVSGGILGFGWKVSDAERELLGQVAEALKLNYKDEAEALEAKLNS